jgi:hypothetical protein
MMAEGHKIDFMTNLGQKVSFMFDLILAAQIDLHPLQGAVRSPPVCFWPSVST